MRLVSLEMSTCMGSIALIENGNIQVEYDWKERLEDRQQLFDALKKLELDWDTIDGFIVGRGPGSFSGLRISFSMVSALAAPGNQKIFAHNSCVSLASKFSSPSTMVVGDARRGQLWVGLFNEVSLVKDFELIQYNQLPEIIDEKTIIISPDQDRLTKLLNPYQSNDLQKPFYPTAGLLGEIVYKKIRQGNDLEKTEPLYMHPPVFIEPKYK